MKIDVVRVRSDGDTGESTENADSDVVMFKALGPIDPNDEIVTLARQFLQKSNSAKMLESFEWAVKNNALTLDP